MTLNVTSNFTSLYLYKSLKKIKSKEQEKKVENSIKGYIF